jgi:dTDP-4-dehydrorhamnose reductase
VAATIPTIYISSDYVFSGPGPHREWDRPLPINEYGRSKLHGEQETLARGGVVVRVSSLFGPYPSHKGPSIVERALTSTDQEVRLVRHRVTPSYAPFVAEDIAFVIEHLGAYIGRIVHSVTLPSVSLPELWASTREVFGLPKQKIVEIPYNEYEPDDGIPRPEDSRLTNTFLPPSRHIVDALMDLKRRKETIA